MSYHKRGCVLACLLTFAVIGVLVGFSASLSFLVMFRNMHSAVWSGVSSVLALVVLAMHLAVWKDITFAMHPNTFTRLMIAGVMFSCLGVAVFIGYLVQGIVVHETGVQVHGWFIVTVWGFMVWKWGFIMFYHARNYQQNLLTATNDILNNLDEDLRVN